MGGDDNRDIYLRANSLFDNHHFEEALALYREFAQKNPGLYKIGVNIGNCLVEMREYDQALAEFRKVLDAVSREASDLKGNNTAAEAFTGIGDLYLRQEKFKEAEENFRKSIDILPGDPALPYNVAEIMFAQGKMDDAEKYFQLAIQIKAEWPKPYLKLAYVSLNKGDMARAVEYLKQFCALGKDDPKLPEAQALLDSLQKK
jgi:tetratricopeptide (TPR) repeat protein